ncbi:thiamine biosynthesis/tRNA modification protein ThiI [mine drainage metagenome]|uniref:Thiamine biosynthesis/tRNA modification protein ThiI n=1 Tax=mine drainage metagenome TaxID=410659 RepID=T0Z9Q0_9ZZZZ
MSTLLLVRYGELALKSAPVRREFEAALRRNLLDQFLRAGLPARVRADHGHLYVEADDAQRAAPLVARVFGVTSVSLVHEIPTDRAQITAALLDLAAPRLPPGASFAVRARRTGQHPFTSQELARDLGGDVLDRFAPLGLRVDLERPDVELFVEVRGPRTYLYFDRIPGPGGLPLGVAGKLVAFVDGPRAALGAWLMMKRGCRVGLVVTAAGAPFADRVLVQYDPHVQRVAAPADPDAWIGAIGALAEETRADGVVLPIGVDAYPGVLNRWGDRVVFSPTIGLTDAEVEERWAIVAARAS